MNKRSIALVKAMGWSVRGEHTVEGDLNRRDYKYLLIDPNGVAVVPDETFVDDFPTEQAAWATAPDIEHDIVAGLAALDATGKPYELRRSITRNCHYCKIYKDDYVNEGSDNVNGKGATRAEACFAALCAYYHVEVSSE